MRQLQLQPNAATTVAVRTLAALFNTDYAHSGTDTDNAGIAATASTSA